MTRLKSIFICQNCGAESPKWIGKCPSCDQWNTYVEEIVSTEKKPASQSVKVGENHPVSLEEITALHLERVNSAIGPFYRVLGGGLFPGSLVLIGGEPGIEKSTLVLQLALN